MIYRFSPVLCPELLNDLHVMLHLPKEYYRNSREKRFRVRAPKARAIPDQKLELQLPVETHHPHPAAVAEEISVT
jgi:hypothetical protein